MQIYVLDEKYFAHREYLNVASDVQVKLADESDLKNIEYVVDGRLTKQHFEKMPNLKAIAIPFAGVNRMDLVEAHKRSVKIVNTHIHSCFVAEKALSLTMALLGNTIAYHNKLRVGDWSDRNDPQRRMKWDSLFGKRVGIYGYGHVGQDIHKLLAPFNCDVYTINRGHNISGVTLVDNLASLAKHSDILFVSVPITNDTLGAIDKNVLAKLKDSYLINVSRGSIINEEDIYNAVSCEQLKGFASDVWYQYPEDELSSSLPSRFPIHLGNNVVLSPHSATATYNAHRTMFNDVVNKLIKLEKGDDVPLLNITENMLSESIKVQSLG